jgi:hypothetical protein
VNSSAQPSRKEAARLRQSTAALKSKKARTKPRFQFPAIAGIDIQTTPTGNARPEEHRQPSVAAFFQKKKPKVVRKPEELSTNKNKTDTDTTASGNAAEHEHVFESEKYSP